MVYNRVKDISYIYGIYHDTMNHYSETADNIYKHKANLKDRNESSINQFIDSAYCWQNTLSIFMLNLCLLDYFGRNEIWYAWRFLKENVRIKTYYINSRGLYTIHTTTLMCLCTHSEANFNTTTVVFPILKVVS